MTKSYLKQLKSYRKEAEEYFSRLGICPTGEETVEYICECVSDESGCEVDDDGYFAIADKLGIEVD
jgi:hypothetical protein